MNTIFLRRRRLGYTSCYEMSGKMQNASKVVRNDTMSDGDFSSDDIVIRWGCTSNISHVIERSNVINTARAIHQVNNKSVFRRDLNEHQLSPPSFWEDDVPIDWGSFPVVVRPCTHSQGRRLYVAKDNTELFMFAERCGEGWYASSLIEKVEEFRVFIVCGKVVSVAKKTPGNPQDVAWNVAQGGRFDVVHYGDWNLAVVNQAIKAFNLTSLHFGGVDVMTDHFGLAYVIEINSAPSLTSPYRQQCMADAFDYSVENGFQRMESPLEDGTWRDFIHPSRMKNE